MFKEISTWVAELRKDLKTCSAAEAKEHLNSADGVLLDVREPGECSEQSVEKSLKVPRGVLEMKLPSIVEDANTPIFVHCATGGRATFAAKQLVELGYTNVTVITCPVDNVCESFQ
jgi:rhodanese-related sulfurtransferase